MIGFGVFVLSDGVAGVWTALLVLVVMLKLLIYSGGGIYLKLKLKLIGDVK